MAVTAFPDASRAAVEILQAGGNAIDAAVAAAWALAVCEPSGSGLGGQTTLLIYSRTGQAIVIDGHSYAPKAVSKQRLTRAQQKKGYGATTIPSTPAALDFAQRRYGLLSREQVMEPAIRLAHDGYAITRLQRRQLSWCRRVLRESPATAKLFLKDGRSYKVGDVFRQPELANTLRRLSRHGSEDFYHGEIARTIARDMKEHGGLITQEDLADCTLPVEHSPISVDCHGYRILTVPPPGGGLQVLLALKIIQQLIPGGGADTERWYEAVAEATHAVFYERDRFPVHPRDLTDSLYQWLLSPQRVGQIAGAIRSSAGDAGAGPDVEEPGETTHLCVADKQGNVVSLTQSIQSLFGAKVANGRLGFLYNNYLTTCPRRPHPYQLGSHCIPRSNAAPTVVLEKDRRGRSESPAGDSNALRPVLTLGAAGSRRITSAILQVITNVVDRGMSLEQAVAFPRVHALKSRKLYIERPAATESLLKRFQRRFGTIRIKASNSYVMGALQAIEFREDGSLVGMADPRRDGTALGR
ncbi:MAG: gamma-glutamyltransferase family protein [Planctomycetota bacterium]|jgi:gamma-glutamyltranspeptidase/glutathione hydrolase